MFFGYGDTGQGWTGGDQAYSVALPDGREVWIFSDTDMGSVVNGSRPAFPYTPIIHNSLVVQSGNQIVETLYQGTHQNPRPLVSPPVSSDWYWFGPGIVNGSTLEIIAIEMTSTSGGGIFAFKWIGTDLATFSLPSLTLEKVYPLESSDGIMWATWLLYDQGYTYIYGNTNDSTNMMHIARVSGTNLLSSWQYYTGSGWSSNASDSSGVLSGVENTYSVTKFNGAYILISMDANDFFNSVIYGYTSASPTGPFLQKTVIFTTPDPAYYNKSPGYDVFTYSAMVHPELSSGNTLVLSYSVNGSGPNAFTNASVYRPRFLNVVVG